LKVHDGLKHAVVGGNSLEPDGSGFTAHPADKLGEINISRAPHTALGTGQTIPERGIRKFFKAVERALDDLPGGKFGKHPGHRTASGTNPAIETIIGFGRIDQFGNSRHFTFSIIQILVFIFYNPGKLKLYFITKARKY
jgi:hypothetical protein